MLDGSLRIMNHLYNFLRGLDVQEAKVNLKELDKETQRKYRRKDKKDTTRLDIVAEDIISVSPDFSGHIGLFQQVYRESGFVITEERGKVGPEDSRIWHNTPVIISDPTDRSSYLESMIEAHQDSCRTIGDVFDAEVERIGEAHARVEGCNASVTLLKKNEIIYSVIINLLTGEVFVAYEPGVFYGNINSINCHKDLTQRAKFKKDETLCMLCYCEGDKYVHNFEGTHLRFFPLEKSIRSPGGPIRFTYLLEEEGNQNVSNVGVIAHNGEKIQESLPNIAVAHFSRGELAAYKLFCDPTYSEQRGGKPLTPNLQNSLYENGLIQNTGIDLTFLNDHDYPSEFRDTTVIIPTKNLAARTMLEGMVRLDGAIRIV